MRSLDVYLHRDLVGHLIQDDIGNMVFEYVNDWLENQRARPLSRSLPLRPGRFNRKESKGFFSGILPEERSRKLIAQNLGISARNDFAMLERIGGECAGAITFMPAGQPLPEDNGSYRALPEDDLEAILAELPNRPLLAGKEGIRLSLAGVQDKLAVHIQGGVISIPLGNAPSTHILKPAIERFEGVVFNELACMQLAAAIEIPTANVAAHRVKGRDYLLVERYDRVIDNGTPRRVHQEDFCQALAIPAEMKYQTEGGPSLKQCFELLRQASSVPVLDLRVLLDAVIFNYLIGNHDAHGKNFSLLYHQDGSIRLAPLYDLVCTAYYPRLSVNMAMKIGGEYRSDHVGLRNFEKLAEEAQLGKPMVKSRVRELTEKTGAALDTLDVPWEHFQVLKSLILSRCEKVIRWF